MPTLHQVRTYVHETADKRRFYLKDMETGHLINAIRKMERDYNEFYLQGTGNKEIVRTMCYRMFLGYRNMSIELAYRRYNLLECFDAEIVSSAVEVVLTWPMPKRLDVHKPQGRKIDYIWIDEMVMPGIPKSKPKPKEKEPIMNMKNVNAISLLQTGYTTVGVEFKETPGRIYTYKVGNNLGLKVGDEVVVDARGESKVVTVKRVDLAPKIDLNATYEYKWVIQKVEKEAYAERLKVEEEVKETLIAVEAEHQRTKLIEKMKAHLPEESQARKMFDSAMNRLNSIDNTSQSQAALSDAKK